jgi:hypothetical protein
MKTFKINFEFTFKKTIESDETGPTDQDLIAYMKGKSTLSDCIRYEDYIEDLFEDWRELKYSKGVVSFKVEEGEFCSVQEIIDFLNTVSPYGHQLGDEVYYPSKNGQEILGKIGIKNLNVK